MAAVLDKKALMRDKRAQGIAAMGLVNRVGDRFRVTTKREQQVLVTRIRAHLAAHDADASRPTRLLRGLARRRGPSPLHLP